MARWPVASLLTLSFLSSHALADGDAESPDVRFRQLSEQISAYRPSLAELAHHGAAAAAEVLNRIDELNSQAATLAAERRYDDANQNLAEAYRLAIDSIAQLTAGQTVTSRLKFDSPRDEYGYELKRFQSNEILVDMMLREGRADENGRRSVANCVRSGKQLHRSAGEQALRGDYHGAVATMEKASMQMNRALQLMGVPSF